MKRLSRSIACIVVFHLLMMIPPAVAQVTDTPMTRLRPIGAPSAVDQYRTGDNGQIRETAYQQNAFQQAAPRAGSAVQPRSILQAGPVRQTVLLQQMDAPQLPGATRPPGNFALPSVPGANTFPGANTVPGTVPPVTSAPVGPPRGLPVNPGSLSPVPVVQGQILSSSDLAPIATPQLNDGFATIDNCNCISAPSSYIAASGCGGCAPVSYQAPQTYVAPPAVIAAPTILPGAAAAQSGVPAGALISFGQEAYPVQVGQGLFGQPVAYVPGQRFRNWLRYIFP